MVYILYSLRSHGWFTKSSTYGSDITQAKVFNREDALAMCRKHKSEGAHTMIPVRQEDVLAS